MSAKIYRKKIEEMQRLEKAIAFHKKVNKKIHNDRLIKRLERDLHEIRTFFYN